MASAKCDSFANKPADALRANINLGHSNTWNLLEFKLAVNLNAEGTVSFTYRKKTKSEGLINNGRFTFDIDFFNVFTDENVDDSNEQRKIFHLKKGLNELSWGYSFYSFFPTDYLFAEILV